MDQIQSAIMAVAIAAPIAVCYFRRATAIVSITAFILALAVCDNATRCASLFALLYVIFILSVDVAEPDKAPIKGKQPTLDGDGRSFAEVADERESD
jgi:hypothetical protein